MKNVVLAVILFIGALFAFSSSKDTYEKGLNINHVEKSYMADLSCDSSKAIKLLSAALQGNKAIMAQPATVITIGAPSSRTIRNEIKLRESSFSLRESILTNISHLVYNTIGLKLSSLKNESLFRVYAFRKIII
jgi:hypothetical protein